MENNKPTIKDIATIAGVSIPTVHKAIYGKPGVSEKTRERVLKITHELNYSINPTASRLKRGTLNLAVVLPLLPEDCNQFFRKIWEGIDDAEKMMQDYNVTLERMPCGRTSADQIPIFEKILKQDNIHGVITYCWDDTTLNVYFEQLLEKGIPVVTVHSDAVNSKRVGCVRASGRRTGQLAAELLGKLTPPSGRVILMSGNHKLKLLRDNAMGFCDYITEQHPGLAILDISNACGNFSLEDTLVQELENHPDIVGIYCNSASNCIAMCHALKRTDKWKHIAAISSDIFAELEPYLMDGTVDASIWQAPELQSKEGVWMLYEYLSGQHLQQEVRYVQLGIVMKNNFHDYL